MEPLGKYLEDGNQVLDIREVGKISDTGSELAPLAREVFPALRR